MTRPPPREPRTWGVRFPDTGRIYEISALVERADQRRIAATFAAAAGLTLMYYDGRRWRAHDPDSATALGWD